MLDQNGILTIAIGKKYAKQAKYLAYSCMINSPNILRAVITDLPDSLNDYYDIIIPYNTQDDPFSLKTRLYEFSPFRKTLFIDADSLVFNNIDFYFNYLENSNFVYFGKTVNCGIWYFDIKKICGMINSDWLPKFNTGMLLFRKSEESKQIFDIAYYYFLNHEKEGIEYPAHRANHYPDEPAFAISLAKCNIKPINDYGRFSRTLINAKHIHLNVLKRISYFHKDERFNNPLIVHFCGKRNILYYLREKIRLFLHFKINI